MIASIKTFSSSHSFCKYSTMPADHLRLAKEHLEQVWTGTCRRIKSQKPLTHCAMDWEEHQMWVDNLPQTSSTIYVHLKRSFLNGQRGSHLLGDHENVSDQTDYHWKIEDVMFQSNVNLIAPLYDTPVLCNCMGNSDTGGVSVRQQE